MAREKLCPTVFPLFTLVFLRSSLVNNLCGVSATWKELLIVMDLYLATFRRWHICCQFKKTKG